MMRRVECLCSYQYWRGGRDPCTYGLDVATRVTLCLNRNWAIGSVICTASTLACRSPR